MTALGEFLRGARTRVGLTQQELAEAAGISVAALRDVEQGRVERPRVSTLRRLALGLGFSAAETDELLRDARPPEPSTVRLRILGRPVIVSGDTELEPSSSGERLLLGLLALSANASVSREELIATAWGEEPPGNATGLLRTRVSRLRRRLRDAQTVSVDTVPDGYRLSVADDQLDLLVFRRTVERARQEWRHGEFDRAHKLFAEAVVLWRGDPADGVHELGNHPAVVRLRHEWYAVVVDYAAVSAELGRHDTVLPLLVQLTTSDPLHEAAHAALMVALAGSGQQGAALTVFHELRRRLVEELGADPCPEVTGAYQRVVRQEVNQQGSTPVTAHRQLPPDISDFSGRQGELRDLSDHLSPEPSTAAPVLSIVGMAGVGKTRLAVHFAYQLVLSGRYEHLQLYVDLRGHADEPPADPSGVLAGFLRLLGVPADQVPHTRDDRAALYRDRLQGRNVMVVLDNADNEYQVEPLLPSAPTNLVLITSRRSLAVDGAYQVSLEPFSPAEATELLSRIVGGDRVASAPEQARRLVELCGRLPLAVALAARRLRSRGKWTVQDLADRLAEASDRIDVLTAGTRRLRTVFDLSYQALDAEARSVFRLLGAHPGEDFTAESVAAMTDRPMVDTRRLMEHLVDEHLVTMVSRDRYRLHDLLREYARAVLADDEPETSRESAVTRVLDHYLRTTTLATHALQPHRWAVDIAGTRCRDQPVALWSREQAKSWLDAERTNLVLAICAAAESGRSAHAWQLTYELRIYLALYGGIHDWVCTHEVTLQATLAAGDLVGEAVTRTHLGGGYLLQGRGDQARPHLDRALELHRAAGDWVLKAATLAWLSRVCHRLGHYDDALEHARRAVELCAERDPYNESLLHEHIGLVLVTLGRLDEAMASYQRRLSLSELTDGEPGQSVVLTNIGDVHRRLGEYDEALSWLDRALAIALDLGAPSQEAYVYHRLGVAYREAGRPEDAISALERSLGIARSFNAMVTEEELLVDLGMAHEAAGDRETALSMVGQSLSRAAAAGNRYEQARAHQALACLHEREGDEAARHSREARTLIAELGVPSGLT